MLLAFLMGILISASSLAMNPGPVNVVKTNDGKTAYCNYRDQVGTPGYRPSLPVVLNRDGDLFLGLGMFGVRCAFSEEKGVHWELRGFNEPYEETDLDGNRVRYLLSDTRLIANNSSGRQLLEQSLDSRSFQVFDLKLPLERLLSKRERSAVREGEVVDTSIEIFLRSKVTAEREGRSRKEYLGEQDGGSYQLFFSLVKDPVTGELKASEVTIR